MALHHRHIGKNWDRNHDWGKFFLKWISTIGMGRWKPPIEMALGLIPALRKLTAEAAFDSSWEAVVIKSCPKIEPAFQIFFDKQLLPNNMEPFPRTSPSVSRQLL